MRCQPPRPWFVERDQRGTSAAPVAALAAILPDVGRERLQRIELSAVEDECSCAAAVQQTGGRETLEMVAEGRCREIDVALDLSCGRAGGISLHHVAQDREAWRDA